MEKVYKNCQSCGMPLKQDPQKGGTHADGSTSTMYCSYCYENGEFTQPDMNAQQMRDFVTDVLKKKGFPGFLAKMFSKGIPKLERWKNG